MKTVNYFVTAICLLAVTCVGQISTYSQLGALLLKAQSDSIQKVERNAALKFHKTLNAYRKKNKLDTIGWDESMWLACRNHCIWMATNRVLEHTQKTKTKNYTGSEPGDRYKYVTSGKGKSQWSGENALYNFDHEGRTANEIATHVAKNAFEQWKNSEGHNENMLGKAHKVHSVAFVFSTDGRLYGTDLFASNIDEDYRGTKSEPVQLLVVQENVTPSIIIPVPMKRVRLDLNNLKAELTRRLYENDSLRPDLIIKKNRAMEKASVQHAEYMSSVKKLTHEELKNKKKYYGKTEQQRMVKASCGFYLLKRNRTALKEDLAMLEVDAASLDIDSLTQEIRAKLSKSENGRAGKLQVGYGISLKRNKNNVKVYVSRLVGEAS